MPRLFAVYPELVEKIDALCQRPGGQRVPWHVTGASALVYDDLGRFYLELTKPKHWTRRDDGTVVVGIGGIGGSVEGKETILSCLHREIQEELGVRGQIAAANETYLVKEHVSFPLRSSPGHGAQRWHIERIELEPREHPRPVLFTISANVYRRDTLPQYPILAIATFWTRISARPSLGDLFGLLVVPRQQLMKLFGLTTITREALAGIRGVYLRTRAPMPVRFVLSPVLTGHSFQILLQRGDLALAPGNLASKNLPPA